MRRVYSTSAACVTRCSPSKQFTSTSASRATVRCLVEDLSLALMVATVPHPCFLVSVVGGLSAQNADAAAFAARLRAAHNLALLVVVVVVVVVVVLLLLLLLLPLFRLFDRSTFVATVSAYALAMIAFAS